MTDLKAMNKRSYPKPLADLVAPCVAGVFARQGFTSCEIVTHWDDIVGAEIAAMAEPVRMQWIRNRDPDESLPATLVLRVEGPAAIEIQHFANLICERVNQFLGWRAVGRLALRQAPLRRGASKKTRAADPAAAARIAETLSDIGDDDLKAALARLGAAIKRV